MIYLDHAASTSMWESALEVLLGSSRTDFANPSSSHRFGRDVTRKIESAREHLMAFLNAGRLYDLYFTSSATESNNTVIKGIGIGEGDLVLVSEADHPSLVEPSLSLSEKGAAVRFIPMSASGDIDREALTASIHDSVKLLVLSQVNNQSGHINDVSGIAADVKKKNPRIHVHVDGVQGFCKIPFDLGDGICDSYSVASHKIGGPKGTAAFLLRKGIPLLPLLTGGGQEKGIRSSTAAAPLILSFDEAVRCLSDRYMEDFETVSALNRLLRKKLADIIPGVLFPFPGDNISPYILNMIIPGISSDIVVRHLEQKNIFISTTSACSSGNRGENKTLSALGISGEYHQFVYRVSFSAKNTETEIDTFCEELLSVYLELAALK